jgi:hypothetical protein
MAPSNLLLIQIKYSGKRPSPCALNAFLQNVYLFQELTEPTVIEQGAYMLIACGAFIFVLSFLGYCGAIKESRVLLTAYGLFIIIIVLLQVIISC